MTFHVPCSFNRAKQPGKLTRLLSCTEEQLLTYRGKDLVTTHVVPSLTLDPNQEHNDHYSAYNKPGAVMFWLQVSQGLSDMDHHLSLAAACRLKSHQWRLSCPKESQSIADQRTLWLSHVSAKGPCSCGRAGKLCAFQCCLCTNIWILLYRMLSLKRITYW